MQHRFEARVTVVQALKDAGLFRGTADNPMRLGLSSRSKDVIEPVLKPQWWVSCKGMADASVAAVRDGSLEIIPKVCFLLLFFLLVVCCVLFVVVWGEGRC